MIRYRLKKKYAILAVVFAGLGLFLLVLGGSYAFFTNQVTSKDYVIYTGNLQIDYTRTGNLINLTKAYPKTNTEGLQEEGYSFNITNNGNIDARYQIRLELDNSNTLPLEYIKMAYIRTKSNSTQTDEEIEPILLSNLNNTLTFISDKQIGAGKEDSYNLKLWIDYNAPNDIQGKTFKATIVVDSLQDVEDGYAMANTRPIITLNKYSDGNTDSHILVNEQFTDPGILSVKDDKDLLTEEDVNITYDYTSDGTNLSQVSGIDTTTPGVYYINYEVTDSDRQEGKIVRTVTVNETASIPTITLNGNSSITINEKKVFTDPGVTVENNNKVAVIGEVKTSVPGTYIVRYIVVDRNNNINSVVRTVIVAPYVCSIEPNTVYTFEFDPDGDGKGQEQTFTVPCDGNYKVELWGAQGGSNVRNIAGASGSYTSGNILLQEENKLNIHIGSQLGYNGGGISSSLGYSNNIGGNGGGATDVRISTTLASRIMVAGGGGGAGGSSGTGDYVYTPSICGYGHTNQCIKLIVSGTTTRPQSQGGNGGGTYAGVGAGTDGDGSSYVSYCIGNGGDGSFGTGGNSVGTAAFSAQSSDNRISVIYSGGTGGGGGGGYFGGGAGGSGCGYWSGPGGYGGGGSSYISGHIGSVAIKSEMDTTEKEGCSDGTTDINCSYFYDRNYIFKDTKIIDGAGYSWTGVKGEQEQMPNPNGGYYASGTGNTGNGYARITYLGN